MTLQARQDETGVIFAVKVVPGSSKNAIIGLLGDALKVNIAVPAEKGKANKELIKILAPILGRPKSDLSLRSGTNQARKEIHVAGLSPAQLHQRLAAYLK